MFQVLVSCLFLSVSMSVTLLLCVVSIFRLLAWIAVNLFKKKQFQIKMVNIVCVVFRLVKKNCYVFSSFGYITNWSQLSYSSLWFYILLYSVLATRHSDNQSGKTCCVFNQSEAKQKPILRTFSRAWQQLNVFPPLLPSAFFSRLVRVAYFLI